MPWGPEEFANLYFPHSERKVPVYATLLKHPNWGVTAEEINEELGFETNKATIDETQRVLREIEDLIEITHRRTVKPGRPSKIYNPGYLLVNYRDAILSHTLGNGRNEHLDLKCHMALACDDPMKCPDSNCKTCENAGIKTCWEKKR